MRSEYLDRLSIAVLGSEYCARGSGTGLRLEYFARGPWLVWHRNIFARGSRTGVRWEYVARESVAGAGSEYFAVNNETLCRQNNIYIYTEPISTDNHFKTAKTGKKQGMKKRAHAHLCTEKLSGGPGDIEPPQARIRPLANITRSLKPINNESAAMHCNRSPSQSKQAQSATGNLDTFRRH